MPTRARDLMEKDVLSVSPETPLLDVHRLFVEEQISVAPVLDDAERVIGVVSSVDLLRAVEGERNTAVVQTTYFRDQLPYSSPDWDHLPEDLQDRLGQLQVSDAMSEGVVSVSADASAAAVAHTLRENRVHHVFVVEKEILVGVISAYDLLELIERRKDL